MQLQGKYYLQLFYVDASLIVKCSMQRDPVVSKASELLRLGLMPSPSELRNGKVRNDRLLVTSSAG